MKKTGVIAAILFAQITTAQDTHYGTHQFGSRSALLGGAVVGGMRDNSMIYYNPAAIAFIDSSSFAINANLYQAEDIHINNILTRAKDFRSLQLTSVPLLTSGQFKTKVPNFRISYGIFAPTAFQFRGQARIAGKYPVVADEESPGGETFVGDENVFSRLRELDFALGLSYKLNDRWSVGLTNLIDIRSHYYNRSSFSYYLLNNGSNTLVNTSLTQSFNYFDVRYMPKVGVAFKGYKWSWGATVTAPGIHMLGNGAIGIDVSGTNVKTGSGRQDIAANNRQTKLKSHFKSPFSVATGVEYQTGNTLLAFSTQYFGREKVYAVLQGDTPPFVQPASVAAPLKDAVALQVLTAARPVLNVALGIEQVLNPKLSLGASIRTNQSYYDPALLNETGIRPDISTWNLYHATGGVMMRKERSSMSLGLAFGFGRDQNRSDQHLPLPTETNFFKNPITETKASYTSLGILVGYNYFFRKG